jgi:hypothetical protein
VPAQKTSYNCTIHFNGFSLKDSHNLESHNAEANQYTNALHTSVVYDRITPQQHSTYIKSIARMVTAKLIQEMIRISLNDHLYLSCFCTLTTPFDQLCKWHEQSVEKFLSQYVI